MAKLHLLTEQSLVRQFKYFIDFVGFQIQFISSRFLFFPQNDTLPEKLGFGSFQCLITFNWNLKYSALSRTGTRVSVQGVTSLGGHFACLCRGFEFYEVKKKFFVIIFQKENGNTFTLLIIFVVKSPQKEQNSTNLLL